MLRNFMNGLKKGSASSVIKQVFKVIMQRHTEVMQLDDVGGFALKLVEAAWREYDDEFSGKNGPRPHRATIALLTLAYHLQSELASEAPPYRRLLTHSYAGLFGDIHHQFDSLKLNDIDHKLLDRAIELAEQARQNDIAMYEEARKQAAPAFEEKQRIRIRAGEQL